MLDRVGEKGLIDQLRDMLPIAIGDVPIGHRRTGLVIVDEVNGFATVGRGPLAPPVENSQVTQMIAETDQLARQYSARGWPILCFLDTHEPDRPEPPYPPHCIRGTGDENLVPELEWLNFEPHATMIRKDCINNFVGSIRPDGSNAFVEWINVHKLQEIVVVGICTDICVMDLVLTALSARNHRLFTHLEDIIVHADGCSTYHLPKDVALEIGLPGHAAHPQDVTHYMGLYFMASRGAVLADRLILPEG